MRYLELFYSTQPIVECPKFVLATYWFKLSKVYLNYRSFYNFRKSTLTIESSITNDSLPKLSKVIVNFFYSRQQKSKSPDPPPVEIKSNPYSGNTDPLQWKLRRTPLRWK